MLKTKLTKCSMIFSLVVMVLIATPLQAARIKDIANIKGVRDNQLIGYGLIVGLDGTGDQTNQAKFTEQTFRNMLNKFGIKIPDNIALQTKNIAAVMVSADLPAFAKPGQKIDVTVSSIGNAKSLRGGTLLLTPLRAANGLAYVSSQGSIIVSGLSAEGADGSKVTVNVPSTGRIPNGGTVEREAPSTIGNGESITYNLNRADFTTAIRMADTINGVFQQHIAQPVDGGSIKVALPMDPNKQIQFIAQVENLNLTPGRASAKIVVNSRTGTVVIGEHVKLRPAAVSHGSLTVTVSENPTVSQPLPFSSNGTTQIVQDSQVQVEEEKNRAFVIKPGPTLQDIVRAVNQVGAGPSDLVAILQALKTAGALEAQMEVI